MNTDHSKPALPKSILEEWIPRTAAMQFLGYGATQTYHLLKSGKIKTAKIGKRIFINRKSLLAFFEANSTQAEF